MPYQHIAIKITQNSYKSSQAIGDVFSYIRSADSTTLILCDGKGHGISANIAATLNTSYLQNLIESGFSTRVALDKLLDFFRHNGLNGSHYSVFTIARIFNDGMVNILNYSMPFPIIISQSGTKILKGREIEINN